MRSHNVTYIPRIDHLRLLAAVLVVGFHFFHYNVGGWQALPNLFWFGFITEGYTGVSLFFVLSGFIFMTIAITGGEIRYGKFLRNRLLRVAPLFLVIFIVAISIGRDRFEATDIFYLAFSNLGDAPTSWHFVTGPAWSISVEFTFYLVFPFLAVFAREQGMAYLAKFILLLLVVKTTAYFATVNSTHMLYSTLIGRFDQFLIGMAAAIIFASQRPWLERHGRGIFFAGVLLIALAVSGQARWASYFLLDQKQPFWVVWGSLEAALWAVVLIGYLSAALVLPRWIDQAFRKGGELSFSIYMWHALVIYLVHELFSRIDDASLILLALNGVTVIAVTFVLSWLSYSVIERPFLMLRGRYTQDG